MEKGFTRRAELGGEEKGMMKLSSSDSLTAQKHVALSPAVLYSMSILLHPPLTVRKSLGDLWLLLGFCSALLDFQAEHNRSLAQIHLSLTIEIYEA